MTLHCGKCRKMLVTGIIVIANMQKGDYDEVTEMASIRDKKTTTVYYCEECMRCVR